MSRNNIQSQIQSLRTHPHIKKVQKINNRLIQLLYYPKDVKSHYAGSQYRIKLELPIKYPEEPPTVKFTDPINHINISERNGEVMMPILTQDWSPYISLYIIIDLIDTLLVQPELGSKYCVGSEKSNRYFRERDKSVMTKVHEQIDSTEFKKIEEIPIFKTLEQEEISMIRKLSTTSRKEELSQQELKPIGTMKKKLKRLKTIILEKSHQINHEDRPPANSPSNFKLFDQFNRIQQEQSFLHNEKEESQSMKIKIQGKTEKFERSPQESKVSVHMLKSKVNEPKIQKLTLLVESIKPKDQVQPRKSAVKMLQKVRSENILDIPTPKKQRESVFFQKQTSTQRKSEEKEAQKDHNSTLLFENTTNNLAKINRMIELFSHQLFQLQKKKTQTKNDYFTKIIEKKVQEQIGMLEQLQELSLTVKKGMLTNLKKQINK